MLECYNKSVSRIKGQTKIDKPNYILLGILNNKTYFCGQPNFKICC